MQEIIEKLLEEVDEDIKIHMLKDTKMLRTVYENDNETRKEKGEYYKYWELLQDPTNTILNWQLLRDRKKIIKH